MKKRLPLVVVLSFGVCLSPWLRGQEGTPEFDPLGEFEEALLPKLVRVQVEYIEVSQETLTTLLAEPRESANDTDLRKEVGLLVDDGKASLVETMIVTGRSGEKSMSESIQEFIYPTEYEPAAISANAEISDKVGESESVADHLTAGPTPTSFETRNVGSTLEVAPHISEDGQIIDLSMAPEIVYHVGNDIWADWKDQRGDASVKMPKLYKLGLTTSVTLMVGQPTMVAALSPKNEDGTPDLERKLMIFVRCEVLTVGR